MPIPASINDLSTTAGSNSPAGSESPSLIDDYLRTYASHIALLRDTKLAIAGGTLTGAVNDATPQTIASGTTTDIGAATSNVVYISGTTTITGLGTIAAGARRTVRFIASLTLTYNATSLILPGGASITTAANDSAEFLSLGAGNWICLDYTRSSGKPVAFAYDRSTILGTVSQSSGVPTGSIIERGSNANGSYVKFADGTMYCALLNQPLSFNNTSNIGFTWTYPQSFAAIEFVGVNAIGTLGVSRVINSISAYARTNIQATVGALSVAAFLAGDQAVLNFDVFAIGRWF